MFGPASDVEGDCNARLFIGDDYGDNAATMRCDLALGHDGKHREKNDRFEVTWEVDEREEA